MVTVSPEGSALYLTDSGLKGFPVTNIDPKSPSAGSVTLILTEDIDA